jgi:hypothetical protein
MRKWKHKTIVFRLPQQFIDFVHSYMTEHNLPSITTAVAWMVRAYASNPIEDIRDMERNGERKQLNVRIVLKAYSYLCSVADHHGISLASALNLVLVKSCDNNWVRTSDPPAPLFDTEPVYYDKLPIPPDLRWAVWERDNFTCQNCGTRRSLAVDHIKPESEGGLMVLDNLQTLCRTCNSRKGVKRLHIATS